MTDDPNADAPVPEPAAPPETADAPAGRTRPVGRLVRTGCIVLGLLGVLNLFGGITTATDPDGAVCRQARTVLEDEDDVDDAADVPCDDAVARADGLAAADEDVATLTTESYVRTVGIVLAIVGAVQAVGGLLTARQGTTSARRIALIGAGLGIVMSFLTFGILAVAVLAFVVYAIFFSGDARAVFGEPGGPRMFRPRT